MEAEFTVTLSLMEVYLEQIQDLLGGEDRLEVKLGPTGMQIPGLKEVEVISVEQAWGYLQTASAARHAAETQMNKQSSRSHCLLSLRLEGRSRMTDDAWRSRLWLVDLAGRERVGKTEATGDRLKEAQFINNSLSALGDCIYALASKSGHVPFRNSKLTYLLQESLAGDGKTLMFVNVNPTDQEAPETVCSLSFASRVRGVELGAARKNVADAGRCEAAKELKAVVGALQHQADTPEAERQGLLKQLDERSLQVRELQAQLGAGRQAPSSHRHTHTAASLGGGHAGHSPWAAQVVRARSLSTPEPECQALWGTPASSGAPDADFGLPLSSGRISDLRQHLRRQLPSPGLSPLGLASEGRASCSSHDSHDSGGRAQPPPRTVPRTPVPQLHFPRAAPKEPTSGRAMPKTTPRSAGADYLACSEAKKSRPGSSSADHASDEAASGPNSARSQEGSKSAPPSPGMAMRPATTPGSGNIKSWKPETAGTGVAKPAPAPAAKGRWS